MWTRSLLKSNAKQALQERYWRSVGLCLLLSLLGIGYSFPRLTAQYRVTSSQLNGMMGGPVWQGNAGGGYTSGNEEYLLQALAPFAGVVIIVMLIAAAISLCWAAFLINPLTVGRNRYFMESRQSATPFSTVTSIFRTPYLNVVKVMLLTNLKIALGSLLIIPGIYWSYCYMQVGYLMAENPYLTTCRAMELSKQMMDGEKWNTFVLQLSFIGWYLLCSITFGIGFIFLEPYVQATFAELYAALRAKRLPTDTPMSMNWALRAPLIINNKTIKNKSGLWIISTARICLLVQF